MKLLPKLRKNLLQEIVALGITFGTSASEKFSKIVWLVPPGVCTGLSMEINLKFVFRVVRGIKVRFKEG